MNIVECYQKLKTNIPIEVLLNSLFIIEHIINAYFISFKKYYRKYGNNILSIIDDITYYCTQIKVIKYGEIGILLYHIKNVKTFDTLEFKDINNYLGHPKVYNNIMYGIKYSLTLNNSKIYKTASFNLEEDIYEFKIKINETKSKIEKLFQKLKIYESFVFKIETWYSKNYLIEKLKTELDLEQQTYLIRLLNSSKFNKLSSILNINKELINIYRLELLMLVSYIKTHKIVNKDLEIQNWENIILEKIIKKDEM